MNHKGFLHRILFLDIETVPSAPDFKELSLSDQLRFERKTSYQRKDGSSAADYYSNAGIWAEFGKIICISTAYVIMKEKEHEIALKSFYGKDEGKLLKAFKDFIELRFNTKAHLLCAHNGKEFDFPFLARRMIVNSIPLPEVLDLMGKKPWQVRHLDTMELWKFGDYKHYTSLDLLTSVLGIPSPKDDLNGRDIKDLFYKGGSWDRIIEYCEKDTIAVVQVYLKLIGVSWEKLVYRKK